jgi:hypothetical protein
MSFTPPRFFDRGQQRLCPPKILDALDAGLTPFLPCFVNDLLDDTPSASPVVKRQIVPRKFIHPFVSERLKVLDDRRDPLIVLNDVCPPIDIIRPSRIRRVSFGRSILVS